MSGVALTSTAQKRINNSRSRKVLGLRQSESGVPHSTKSEM